MEIQPGILIMFLVQKEGVENLVSGSAKWGHGSKLGSLGSKKRTHGEGSN